MYFGILPSSFLLEDLERSIIKKLSEIWCHQWYVLIKLKNRGHPAQTCKKIELGNWIYQPGDSLFDLFYKFSALQQFCMHSDWVMGYLITYYLLPGKVSILEATGNSITHCTENSMTCHGQTPSDMERLTVYHHFWTAQVS